MFLRRHRRALLTVIVVCAVAFLALQAVPYGHDHGAPPTTKQARLDPAAAQIADGACMDCHSNKTEWPWYSNVAPFSLLVVNDVKGGRERMNLSRWDQPQPDFDEVMRMIEGGAMPPLQYKAIHGASRLSDTEKRTLIDGFRRLYASDPPPGR